MKQILATTRKELEGYFGSPMALIFVGVFLAFTLFSFFWLDSFFARGIADVRPLFRRMPLLMIILIAALTMRQWSEEQRSGTLEVLLTLPVSRIQLVVGKFLAVLALVVLSLGVTLSLPITVSVLGNLDWGPVFGGYLAAILLAGAYAAIGLFVSSRTDNQIVAFILTGVVCGLFFLIGSDGVTDFFGDRAGEILRAIGSGSRFESIERGVVDLRDLIYYLSLTGVFLTLNVVSLNSKGWSNGERTLPHRRAMTITTALVVLNLVLFNVWMFPLHGLRLDLTAQQQYSLSDTTRDILTTLQEPLMIRGYFSEKTHPLLAPLVPRIRDMLREYEVASGGRIELEIVDPAENPELEAEANQTYGIQPTPFQVEGRYETSIINSYFDILIRYGDQNVVLNFRDLIEIEPQRSGDVEVRLRNLEYDLTSSIRKVVFGFQSVESILAALESPAELTIYVTPETLPPSVAEVPDTIESVAQEIADRSGGKFTYTVVNPESPDSSVTPQDLRELYNLEPFYASLFSDETYYLHMVLTAGDKPQVIYPSGDMTEADIRDSIESALKRASPGFLQVVGLWTPPAEPTQNAFGQMQQPISSWEQLRESLRQEYEVQDVDLSAGQVPMDVDVLLLVAPQGLTEQERYAVDQYLMRGGSVIMAAGNYAITLDQFSGGLGLKPLEGGVQDLLASYGITVEETLVMDPQNERFPVPVTRNVGGMEVQQMQAIEYPYFVDVRPDGMASGNAIVSNLSAVTLNWVSPVTVDEEANENREVTTLLESSPSAWTRASTNITPNFDMYPELGFAVGEEQKRYPLAVAVHGVFESAFEEPPAPSGESEGEGMGTEMGSEEEEAEATPEPSPGLIETSPETARLVVIGSAEFVDDVVFEISSNLSRERYINSLKLVQNAVAWSTEDLDLLNIRSRGTYARVLRPMTERQQSSWEILNYVVALLALGVIAGVWNANRANREPMELLPPEDLDLPVQGGSTDETT